MIRDFAELTPYSQIEIENGIALQSLIQSRQVDVTTYTDLFNAELDFKYRIINLPPLYPSLPINTVFSLINNIDSRVPDFRRIPIHFDPQYTSLVGEYNGGNQTIDNNMSIFTPNEEVCVKPPVIPQVNHLSKTLFIPDFKPTAPCLPNDVFANNMDETIDLTNDNDDNNIRYLLMKIDNPRQYIVDGMNYINVGYTQQQLVDSLTYGEEYDYKTARALMELYLNTYPADRYLASLITTITNIVIDENKNK